jgi:hypothetical protein
MNRSDGVNDKEEPVNRGIGEEKSSISGSPRPRFSDSFRNYCLLVAFVVRERPQ